MWRVSAGRAAVCAAAAALFAAHQQQQHAPHTQKVPSLLPLQLAAHKALTAEARGTLVTRSLHAEALYNISGSKHISESLRRFGVESTVRPSLSFYNTKGEIDRLVDAVKRINSMP